MQDKRKRRGINLGSILGWLIFVLLIAGRPIFQMLQRAFGGGTTLPTNLLNMLPVLIGVLVVLSVIVSAVRAAGNSRSSGRDVRLPTDASMPQRPPNAPMPPFGTAPRAPQPQPPSSPRAFTLPSSSVSTRLPPPPRFEPMINPTILVLGILGLVVLGGIALVVFVGGVP